MHCMSCDLTAEKALESQEVVTCDCGREYEPE